MLQQIGHTTPLLESEHLQSPGLSASADTIHALCVGTFDSYGIPITLASQQGDYALTAFQVISLKKLISCCLDLGISKACYIRHQDGTILRIERHLRGFVCYLESLGTPMAS